MDGHYLSVSWANSTSTKNSVKRLGWRQKALQFNQTQLNQATQVDLNDVSYYYRTSKSDRERVGRMIVATLRGEQRITMIKNFLIAKGFDSISVRALGAKEVVLEFLC